MLGFFEQNLVSFGTLLITRMGESWFTRPRSGHTDETALVRSRLSPAVANILDGSGARVTRISGEKQLMVAQTRYIFPRTSIFIDYDERQASADFEDFIILHEIAHLRGHHPLIKMLYECVFMGTFVTFALKLTIGNPSLLIAAAIAIPLIVLGFAALTRFEWAAVWLMEFQADAFAARYIGYEIVIKQLEKLKTLFHAPPFKLTRKNLDARIRRLRSNNADFATARTKHGSS